MNHTVQGAPAGQVNRRGWWLAGVAVSAALIAAAHVILPEPPPPAQRVTLSRRVPPPRRDGVAAERERPLLRVAFATMISPTDTHASYGRLAGYLAARMGARPEVVHRGSYGAVNELLAADSLSLAFICSGAYPEAHERYGARPLAVPVIDGRATYRSYVLAPASSAASSLASLAGARVALVDPRSLTGRLYLLSRLRELAMPPPQQVSWTFSHDRSIRLVARGLVDAAPIDSLVWERLARSSPQLTGATKILERSPEYPAPPFVVPKSCPDALSNLLGRTLFSMHRDPAGKVILDQLGIDRFESTRDSSYDIVRRLQSQLEPAGHTPARAVE
ncbi:MAG: PhnD/SsuA/transferrin family substrate-binding protein [Candidatus Wallbacteria bacterium]|nr:PhnD/SsuA/transferrin family substrate-binding protein [Candidatus Wallbacteria bacterium]